MCNEKRKTLYQFRRSRRSISKMNSPLPEKDLKNRIIFTRNICSRFCSTEPAYNTRNNNERRDKTVSGVQKRHGNKRVCETVYLAASENNIINIGKNRGEHNISHLSVQSKQAADRRTDRQTDTVSNKV